MLHVIRNAWHRLETIEQARPDYSTVQVRDLWDDACSAVGLVRSIGHAEAKRNVWPSLGSATQIVDGVYRIALHCPMGQSVSDVAKVAAALREAVEAVHLEVEAPNGLESRGGFLLVDLRPRSNKPLLWKPPSGQGAALLPVGRSMIGRPLMLPVPGRAEVAPHVLMAGATGAGKTNVMHVAMGSLLAAGGVRIYGIDPGAVDLALWHQAHTDRQVFEGYATTADEWTDLLQEVYDAATANRAFIVGHGKTNLYECQGIPGCPSPIVLMIDELQRVARKGRKAERLILEIVQELRKFGVMVVAAMLTASFRDFDLGIRSNFAVRSCGRLLNGNDIQAVMGESYAPMTPAHTLPVNRGQAYVLTMNGQPPARVQYRYLKPELIPSIVGQYAPRVAMPDPRGPTEEGPQPPPKSPKESRPHSLTHSVAHEELSGGASDEFWRFVADQFPNGSSGPETPPERLPRDEPTRIRADATDDYEPGHPLARSNGMVSRAKRIAFDTVDGEDVACSQCDAQLSWTSKGADQVQVVALDHDRSNLTPTNLAPMCRKHAASHHRRKAA